jgi:hypothetical protein
MGLDELVAGTEGTVIMNLDNCILYIRKGA